MNTPVKITADAAIGISGKPIIVYHVSIKSGGTASVLSLCDGTAAGTELMSLEGTADKGKEFDFGEGVLFPAGCFADKDANLTYATIWYNVVSTS